MSTLREMVSREMRALPLYTNRSGHDLINYFDAVEVALRLLGKWGHVAGCGCHEYGGPETIGNYEAACCQDLPTGLCALTVHDHPVRDPRCAQPGGGENE